MTWNFYRFYIIGGRRRNWGAGRKEEEETPEKVFVKEKKS
jgi:hypothetical protein